MVNFLLPILQKRFLKPIQNDFKSQKPSVFPPKSAKRGLLKKVPPNSSRPVLIPVWWNEWTTFQSWKNQAFFDPETEKKDLEGALIHKRYKKDNKKFYYQYSYEIGDKALNHKQVHKR